MQLLVFIAKNADVVSPILRELMENKIGGGTVVECEGMLQALYESQVEPPPLFGSLRQFLNPASAKGKILFVVLADGQLDTARETNPPGLRRAGQAQHGHPVHPAHRLR